MAFEDCKGFMNYNEQKIHNEYVKKRWIKFGVLALITGIGVAISNEPSFWLVWSMGLIIGAMDIDMTN